MVLGDSRILFIWPPILSLQIAVLLVETPKKLQQGHERTHSIVLASLFAVKWFGRGGVSPEPRGASRQNVRHRLGSRPSTLIGKWKPYSSQVLR